MTKATRIRRLAARKVRIEITKRKRGCLFVVTGPDGHEHIAVSRTEALNVLLVRLRCWTVEPWKIQARAK